MWYGASYRKLWPIKCFIELANNIQHRPILADLLAHCLGLLLRVSFLWMGCFLILALSAVTSVLCRHREAFHHQLFILCAGLSHLNNVPLMCTFCSWCFLPFCSYLTTFPSFIFFSFLLLLIPFFPPLPTLHMNLFFGPPPSCHPPSIFCLFLPSLSAPPHLLLLYPLIPILLCLCSSVTAVRLPDGLSFVVYEFWDGEEEWKRWVFNSIRLKVFNLISSPLISASHNSIKSFLIFSGFWKQAFLKIVLMHLK